MGVSGDPNPRVRLSNESGTVHMPTNLQVRLHSALALPSHLYFHSVAGELFGGSVEATRA
jgi:hypothetical protein